MYTSSEEKFSPRQINFRRVLMRVLQMEVKAAGVNSCEHRWAANWTSRMKALSRMYVWWPGIGQDIEKSVRLCSQCQEQQSLPPVAPLNPWKWPTRPWARLHFEGKSILIIIDAHSKWIEATCTPSTSSSSVIDVLRSIFARFGVCLRPLLPTTEQVS